MQQAFLPDLCPYNVILSDETDFNGWRDAARRLCLNDIAPDDITWRVEPDSGRSNNLPEVPEGRELRVSKEFVDRAAVAICHKDAGRFDILYRLLWVMRKEPDLLRIATEPDVRTFEAMEKSIRRDIHKMRAFVRFRKVGTEPDERYISWFEPEHFIVRANADFFQRRFAGMNWSILTPQLCVHWNRQSISFSPGLQKSQAPAGDATEELWLTYYENIFNPARLKIKAMQAEMPKKYWRNLPEASLIPGLVAGADASAAEMIARMPTVPAPHHAGIQARHWPEERKGQNDDNSLQARSIAELRDAAKSCRRCPLWCDATQTVFGDGPERPAIVFVGEQPGDQEDIAGKPFVGPAGKVFDAVIEEAGIDRRKAYVTNAVKHFKFVPRGKRRIHSKPNAGEVQACNWWLDRELALTRPTLIVALGATAAQALLGETIAITKMRGQLLERADGMRVFLTIHPSFILRIPEQDEKNAERRRFLRDMLAVKELLNASSINGSGSPSDH